MFHKACRVKTGKSKFVNKFFQWHPILQTNRNSDGKAVDMLRIVAPSFAISMKISPNVPSLYSPVRKKMACPLIFAFCVKPRRFAGNERRSTILASLRFNFVSGDDWTLFCTSSSNSSIVNFPRSTMWDSVGCWLLVAVGWLIVLLLYLVTSCLAPSFSCHFYYLKVVTI